MPWRAVTVTTTIRKIAGYNRRRKSLTVMNNGTANVGYSQDPSGVDTEGLILAPGSIVTLVREDGDEPEADLFAVATSGSQDVRVQESIGE